VYLPRIENIEIGLLCSSLYLELSAT